MKKVRWGIVGTGFIANKFAQAVKNVERAYLVGVASRTEKSGTDFAQKHHIERVFSSYEEMALSDEVDAVYIATPHPFHISCAKLFLNEKKHVLCEKPLCVNALQAEELKSCAEENGVFLMEAMWTRFLPAVNCAVDMVKSGVIGEVSGLTADFCYASSPEVEPKLFQNDMAGGSLLDVGVYGLNFASFFLGDEPEEICSLSNIEDDVDTHICVLLKYRSGTIASISSATKLFKPEDAYIYGSKGYIKIPQFYGAREFFVYTDEGCEHIEKPPVGDGFEEEIYEACRCIADGKIQSEIHPIDKSIGILKQMDYIRNQNGIKYPFDN